MTFNIKSLLMLAVISSSLNATEKKHKENFDNDNISKKAKIEKIPPSLPAVVWGKIFGYCSQKDKMGKRSINKKIKRFIDLNTHFIEVPGELTEVKELCSLKLYLSNNEIKNISHVQFTGGLTSFPVFQLIAKKIGNQLISLKGLHNDLFSMFKEGQYFYNLFPNLKILHTLNDYGDNNNQERSDFIFYKPIIQHNEENERWTILHELPKGLEEIEYKETEKHNQPYENHHIDDLGIHENKTGLLKLFELPKIKKITLQLESSELPLTGMPETATHLSLFCGSEHTQDTIDVLKNISDHKNLISLKLNGFILAPNKDEDFFPKKIQRLHLINCLMADEIFNIISKLPFLKKLKLIDMRLEDDIDVSLNIPHVRELKISFDPEASTQEDIKFSIQTLCKQEKMDLKSLKNIDFKIYNSF